MLRATVFELYDLARCTLWVEDDLTRRVLTDFWGDKDIRILTAGGRSGVEHLVRAAPRGFRGKNVLGFADRDFSTYDAHDWSNMDKPILFTPTHEFENLLLDFDVLSTLSGQDRPAIEAEAKAFAGTIKWWMVCKRVRYDLFGAVSAYFPAHPAVPSSGAPMDRQAAVAHLNRSNYRKEHATVLRTWNEAYIEQQIDEWAASYEADLASGEWVRSFSGKEIFRYVRSQVKSLARLAKGKTAAENDEDLGKRIASMLQRSRFAAASTVRVFNELRAALRTRAGLPPQTSRAS